MELNVYSIVFELVVNFYQASLASMFSIGCQRRKRGYILPCMLSTTLLFTAITIQNYISNFEGLSIFIYVLILFMISCCFCSGSVQSKLFYSVVPICAVSAGTILSVNLISVVTKQSVFDSLTYSNKYRLYGILLSNLVMTIISVIVFVVTKKHKVELKNHDWIFLVSLDVSSIIIYTGMFYLLFEMTLPRTKLICLIIVIFVISINVLSYCRILTFNEKIVLEKEVYLLKMQSLAQRIRKTEFESYYNSVKKVKHDISNILAVIYELNQQEKRTEIRDYIKNISGSISETHAFTDFVGDCYVDSIISIKISEANSFGISVELNIGKTDVNTNNFDVCTLIGNLFDNSIRAAKNSREKRIIFEMFSNQNSQFIRIMNSIDQSVLECNPQLNTDKKDGGHGYGTRIIRNIVEKYSGRIQYSENNGFFCCHIVFSPYHCLQSNDNPKW